MVNFILCDDDIEYLKRIKDIIDRYMMKNQLEYKMHLFNDYDDNFLEIIEKKLLNKVYILDIETPTRSGIDIARIIRAKDINSVLIFLTGHQELDSVVIKNDFLFLAFINKFDASEKRLNRALRKSLDIFGVKPKMKFIDNGFVYNVRLEDILYIVRDTVDRKCLIKTDTMEFKLSITLSELLTKLPPVFKQVHRSCIINTNRIFSVNKPMRLVTFDNGETIDLISETCIGELI